jgi:low temperature requirement protein LtrA
VIYDGRKAGRNLRGPILSAVTIAIACVLTIVAAAIPTPNAATAHTKVALFYLAIAGEIASTWYLRAFGLMSQVKVEHLVERYAAQSLIIM